MKKEGFRVKLDNRNEKIGYKIRDWETQKVPYMLIIGEREKESNSVSVREHKVGNKGVVNIEDFIYQLKNKVINKIIK